MLAAWARPKTYTSKIFYSDKPQTDSSLDVPILRFLQNIFEWMKDPWMCLEHLCWPPLTSRKRHFLTESRYPVLIKNTTPTRPSSLARHPTVTFHHNMRPKNSLTEFNLIHSCCHSATSGHTAVWNGNYNPFKVVVKVKNWTSTEVHWKHDWDLNPMLSCSPSSEHHCGSQSEWKYPAGMSWE